MDPLRSPWNILTSSTRGFSRYAECIQTLLAEARNRPRPLVHVQVAGLSLAAVPIEQASGIAAYFVLGPCLVGRRGEPDDYIALAKEFDIRIDQWMEALQEIKVFSFIGLNSIASLLHYLAQLAFPKPPSEEPREKRVLKDLLDAAIQAVGGDSGSILVVGRADPAELSIQVSRGLKEEVARTVRVRLGEGIAGLAAAEKTSLRLNRQIQNPRLEKALRRPELEDAMVVPFSRGEQLFGVLCVSTSREGQRLREDGIGLLQQLTRLASGALSS